MVERVIFNLTKENLFCIWAAWAWYEKCYQPQINSLIPELPLNSLIPKQKSIPNVLLNFKAGSCNNMWLVTGAGRKESIIRALLVFQLLTRINDKKHGISFLTYVKTTFYSLYIKSDLWKSIKTCFCSKMFYRYIWALVERFIDSNQ